MTNIIDGRADQVAPSGWSTVGQGLSGLGEMLAGAFAARDAAKAAKMNPQMEAWKMANTSPDIVPTTTPAVPALPSATPVLGGTSFTPQAMQPVTPNLFGGSNDMGFKLGRDVGIAGILPSRFPQLFKGSVTQYGGL